LPPNQTHKKKRNKKNRNKKEKKEKIGWKNESMNLRK
jgi:hypothetical protein